MLTGLFQMQTSQINKIFYLSHMKFSFTFQLPELTDDGEITQIFCKEMKPFDNIIKIKYSIIALYRQIEKHIRLLLGLLSFDI